MPTGSKSGDGRPSLLFEPRFTVYRDGRVYDRRTDTMLQPYFDFEKNEMVIKPDVMRQCDSIAIHPDGTLSLGLLMALAYKNVFLRGHVLAQLKVLYEDDNPRNCTPENLILQYPEGGIECSYWPGYYYIPGYSSYLIHKETYAIYSFSSNCMKDVNKGITGYLDASLSPDSGGATQGIGLHRIVALTFVPYTKDVRSRVVNHIDTNKQNNTLSNLEWTTNENNLRHGIHYALERKRGFLSEFTSANEFDKPRQTTATVKRKYAQVYKKPEGVYKNNVNLYHRIDVKDLYTGEILSFKNQRECAAYFKCNPSSINFTLNKRANKSIFQQHYVVKRGIEEEWPYITKEHINSASFSGGREVVVKDLTTGDEKRYDTAIGFVRDNKLSKKIVTTALKAGKQRVLNNLLFKYADNPDPWIK